MSDPNARAYDRVAERFAEARAGAPVPAVVRELAALVPAGAHLLDVGCGSGEPIARFLVDAGFAVTAFDASRRLAERARANVPGARVLVADVRTFAAARAFDGAVAHDSLFHLRSHEHEPALARVHGVLRPGGALAFTHGGGRGELTGEMLGERFTYSSPGPDALRRIVEGIGFAVLRWDVDRSEPNGYLTALVRRA